MLAAGFDGAMMSPTSEIHERLYRTGTRARTPARSDTGTGMGGNRRGQSQSSAAKYLSEGRPLFSSPTTGGSTREGGGYGGDGGGNYLSTREEEELKECTFQPKINATFEARPVQSR